MEEKYLYTIAIIVIFAGFLFTSVGNYTGRVSSVYAGGSSDSTSTLYPSYSSDVRSSVSAGFGGQPKSNPKQVAGASGDECLDVEEGDQRVIDRIRGLYVTCSNGKWIIQSCPVNNVAIQRLDGVACSIREGTN